jgi:hypothetical protein
MKKYDYKSQPWASGPAEILEHGLELLAIKDSDRNRRLAIISIDNSVELMIKTYLNLPGRITGLKISRKRYAEFSESFPKLLDAMEQYASVQLEGVDLGEVEWYHRLRNELYHQGNGLTVERRKVEVYAELAKILFKNLYGIELLPSDIRSTDPLAMFMNTWVDLEQRLHSLASERGVGPYPRALIDGIRHLHDAGKLTKSDVDEFNNLRRLRNMVVHGELDIDESLTKDVIGSLLDLVKKLPVPKNRV